MSSRHLNFLLRVPAARVSIVLLQLILVFPVIISGESISWDPKNLLRLDGLMPVDSPVNTVHSFFVADMNLDGRAEVCLLRSDPNYPYFIVIRDLLGNQYLHPGRPAKVSTKSLTLFPLEGGPSCCFAAWREEAGESWIDIYDYKAVRRDSIATLLGSDRSGDGLWSGYVDKNAALVDLNQDQRLDLLVQFNTGADQQPRALVGYDLETKRTLLEYRFAPMLSRFWAVDVDDDGGQELVTALAGASDGPRFGRFSRDSSYLAILEPDGNLKAAKSFAGESSYVTAAVADLDGDHLPEIVAGYYSLLQHTADTTGLYVLDGRSLTVRQELHATESMSSVYSLTAADLDGDGIAEIIFSTLSGKSGVIRYDRRGGNLAIAAVVNLQKPTIPLLIDDIDLDGAKEMFIATVSPRALWLVSQRLQPLAWMPVQSDYDRLKLTRTGLSTAKEAEYLLLDGGMLYRLTIPVARLYPPPAVSLPILGKRLTIGSGVVVVTGLLFLPFGGGLGWLLYVQNPGRQGRAALRSSRIGVASINGAGRIIECNPCFLRLMGREERAVLHRQMSQALAEAPLRPLLEHYQDFIGRHELYAQREIELTAEKPRHLVVELIRISSRPVTVMYLVDLTESAQQERLKIWAAMALRMAHKTKTPLASILLAVQRLQRAYKKDSPEQAVRYDEFSGNAVRAIERVRESISTFMKFARLDAPVFVVDDFSRVVQESLQEYLPRIPDEVELQTRYEPLEMRVLIDIGQFKEAFFNLLDNALTAVRGQGVLSLQTLREKHPLHEVGEPDQALLEISDNGVGMRATELSSLFSPGYTTSETGSGMGLVLAKSIVESHGGSIDIESRPSLGTTVYVRLPIHQTRK